MESSLFEARELQFNGEQDDGYWLRGLRLEAAPESEQWAGAVCNEKVDEKVRRYTSSTMILDVGDNSLKVI